MERTGPRLRAIISHHAGPPFTKALGHCGDAVVAVEFDELSHAFDFVGSAPPGEHNAYISLDTGQIHWSSESGSLDEEVPDDLETSDRYLVVPHKTDLDLGRSLALRFAGSELTDCQDHVPQSFRR